MKGRNLFFYINVILVLFTIFLEEINSQTTGTTGSLTGTTGVTTTGGGNGTTNGTTTSSTSTAGGSDKCTQYTEGCSQCIKHFECGWCDSGSYCFYGNPKSGQLHFPQDCSTWYWTQCKISGTSLGTSYTYIILGCVIGVLIALCCIFSIWCAVKRCKKKKEDGSKRESIDMSYYKAHSAASSEYNRSRSSSTRLRSASQTSSLPPEDEIVIEYEPELYEEERVI